MLTLSLLLAPHSGKIPIAAYCVEHGRWTARAGESVDKFDSAANAMPSREAKIAMLAPARPATPQESVDSRVTAGIQPFPLRTARQPDNTAARQAEVWSRVAEAQRKLSGNLAAPVESAKSQSSLQLSLENEKLDAARKAYVEALSTATAAPSDANGYVVAINGRIDSGDVYGSAALFHKMWPKQLAAAATAAIADRDAKPVALASAADILATISTAAARAPVEEIRRDSVVHATRETEAAYLVDTRRDSGEIVHRALLAR